MLDMIEGRRLHTKLSDGSWNSAHEDRARLSDAANGSALLRDAILLAKGIIPLPVKNIPLPLARPKEVVQIPQPCPLCGAPEKPQPVFVKHIQDTVAAYFGFHPRLMTSAERGRNIARPRQIAMFLAHELTGKSLPDIGKLFNRDHTTVLHAIREVPKRMYADAEVLLDVEVLRERLGA